MDSELSSVIITVAMAILTPLITYYLGSRKEGLQATFRNSNETRITILTLRNTSNKVIFIDRVDLYQSLSICFNLTDKFEHDRLGPGDSVSIMLQSDTLKTYVDKALEIGKMSRFYRKYGSYRMGFKLIIKSSVGVIGTTWFKIGVRSEYWTQYDYMFHNGSYYSFRRFYNQNRIYFGYIIVFITGIMAYALREDGFEDEAVWVMLLCYVIMLIQVTLYSAGGYRNNHTPTIMGFITGIPLYIAFYMYNPQQSTIYAGFILYLILTAYHCLLTSRMSGWNL